MSPAPLERDVCPPGDRLARFHDVALLDLDGVVYVGPHAVPHAAEALDRALAEHGLRSVFVTNNAARPPGAVAEHLVGLGISADSDDVVTSAQAGARMLADQLAPGARVLAVGGPGVAAALRERGLVPVFSADDAPDAVIQGYGPAVGWADLAEACLAISQSLPWVATNLDATIPTSRGRVLGNGSLVAAVSRATGVEPQVAGKPEPPLMVESVQRVGARRPLVVGDRLDTDIEGAWRCGLPSLLVLTGVTDWQDVLAACPEHRPTHIGWDLRSLVEPLPASGVVAGHREVRAWSAGVTIRVPVGLPGEPTASRQGPSRPESLWWLPPSLPDPGRGPADPADLDLVRATVGAAWASSDASLPIVGVAEVSVTR